MPAERSTADRVKSGWDAGYSGGEGILPAATGGTMVCILRGPDLVYESADESYLRVIGNRDIIGQPIASVFPEFEDQGVLQPMREALASGHARRAGTTPILFPGVEGGPPEQRIVDFVYQPILDDAGTATGLMVICTDVTDIVDKGEEGQRVEAAPNSVLVLDAEGAIQMVNTAWKRGTTCLGDIAGLVREGANLLAICDLAASKGSQDAGRMGHLIRYVRSGRAARDRIEYEMDMPDGHQWFCVTASAFQGGAVRGDDADRIVVTHENITQKKISEQRLAFLATHDPLTELPNRYLLESRAGEALSRAQMGGDGLSVLFLDIEPFRHLTDIRTRFVDDVILQSLARELKQAAPQAHTIARLNGDQFVILVTGPGDVGKTAEAIGFAISLRLMAPIQGGARDVSLKGHVGIAVWPRDGETFDELLRNAEAALAETRLSGNPSITFYSPDIGQRLRERAMIESELRHAVRLDQLRLEYQPQLRLSDGALMGLEALVRWHHPQLGEIPPDRFISIAESTGLIQEIGDWVVARAARQMADCPALGNCRVGVNVSPAQLRHSAFVDHVASVLAETGLPAERLELEITENIYLADSFITASLDRLKALGLSVAIDDFGTGYSNLSALRRLDIDRLKIDPSFVRDLPGREHASAVTHAIVTMGKSLGLQVIGEGVEDEAQARFLTAIGCDEVQGFLYGRPMLLEDVVHWNSERICRKI